MLTEKAVAQAKPQEKIYRMYDQAGTNFCLEVTPAGGKRWRLRYRHQGKEKMMSLGTYPLVTLKEARERAWAARKEIERGVDPVQKKKAATDGAVTFRRIAREWWEKFMEPRGGKYPGEVWRRIEREALPFIGDMPLGKITAPDILEILRRVEARGVVETAHKIKNFISQVLRYGIACGLIHHNPARDLNGALAPRSRATRPAIIDPKAAGELMRKIKGYERPIIRCGLVLAALTFVRPGELRHAEWSEVDLQNAEWRIPAEKMKMKRPHIVPLARQAIEVLQDLKQFTGEGKYLFPSVRTGARPMSDGTINAALRALGYAKNEMTGHGFRAMATSLLSEQGWGTDAIERQLAHVEANSVRAAYHRSEHLEERRKMMQAWADYLDKLASEF